MINVLILKSWVGGGRLAEQWPASPPAEFADIRFHFEEGATADYVVVLNSVRERREVFCPPERVWAMVQEPPTRLHRPLHKNDATFRRIYTTDNTLWGGRYRPFWGAMEWHVGLDYEELVKQQYPPKTVDLAWVTSNLEVLPGHRKRMTFLRTLQAASVPLDLWGRGFKPAASKWSVLSPARYAISFENYAGTAYWSEKLTDCFLSFSTPLYYGSPDISRYFPAKSFFLIDPSDPFVADKLKDVVQSSFHEDNREALMEARERCLKPYNTLFFIAQQIKDDRDQASFSRRIVLTPVAGQGGTPVGQLQAIARAVARRLLSRKVFAWARSFYLRLRHGDEG